jgi:DNA-binding transcriptional regulator YdaS (Cro superfamily)
MRGMNLRTYITSQPRGALAALADAIGVHRVLVSQWTAEKDARPIPVQHCPAIETFTQGAVRRWDTRPEDWYRIWPELIGTDGAPVVPERAKAA